MDSFNKVISFVLGLVVVLVFFAVVTGKINLKSKTGSVSNATLTPTPIQKNSTGFFGFFKSTSPTPTPTTTQKPSPITINTNTNGNNTYKQYNQTSSSTTPKSIPATGLPALFIPILFSGLVGGSLLRKSGKK